MGRSLTSVFLNMRQSLQFSMMRIVRDPHIAEDLTQEAYIRAHKAMDQGPVDHLEGFLNHAARNLALDHLRRRKTQARHEVQGMDPETLQELPQAAPSVEQTLTGRESLAQLAHALAALPQRAQTALVLSRIEGWSNRRIAAYLNVSERTVFNDLKLAMGHCRDRLAHRDDG